MENMFYKVYNILNKINTSIEIKFMDKIDTFFLGVYLGTLGMYIFRLFF